MPKKKIAKKVKTIKNVIVEENESTISKNVTKEEPIEEIDEQEPEVEAENLEEIVDKDDEIGDNEAEIDDEDKKMTNDDEEEQYIAEDEGDEGGVEVIEGDAVEDPSCLYNYPNENSDDEIELVFDDDEEQNQKLSENSQSQRITKPILYNYERVRLLGDRTQQLTLGAKPMVKNTENLTPKQIAQLEIEHNVIPLIIERPLPNGKRERWYISELKQ